MRAEVDELRAEAEGLRTELRRRERLDLLSGRQAARRAIAAGEVDTLRELLEGSDPAADTPFAALRFMRESATEVRLGYAAAARQSITFTDGSGVADADDLASARDLWARGWEPGTPAARGVRVYPVGSRAERVVPLDDVRVEVLRLD